MKNLIFSFCFLIFIIGQSNTAEIRIGASVHGESDYYFDEISSPRLVAVYEFFEHWINNEFELIIGGEKHEVKIIILNDDRTNIEQKYEELVTDYNVHLLVSSASDLSARVASEVSERHEIPLLVVSPDPSVYINKTTVFNIYPNPYSQLYDILPLLRIAGVKSVHVLEIEEGVKACYGIQEIFEMNFIKDVIITRYKDDDTLLEAVDKVIKEDKDLLLYCDMYQKNYNNLTRILYDKQYVPRAGLNLMLDKYDLDPTYSDYWMMYHFFHDGVSHPKTKYLGDYENVKKEMTKYFESNPPDGEFTVDDIKEIAVILLSQLELAINAFIDAGSIDSNKVIDAIRRSKYDSLMGKISFASDNTHLISGIGYQIINATTQNILLPSQLSNATIVYPAPQYDERVKSSGLETIEIIVFVFLGIFTINSLVWMVYVIVNRNNKIINSASPIFLIGMLFGSIIVYLSIITLAPSLTNNGTCVALPWLLSLGFIILFGSMLVKTWRVHLIFSKKTFEVFRVSNRKVLLFLSILVAIDVLLLVLWTAFSKMEAVEVIVDEHRINQNYESCSSSTAGKIFVWILVAYKGLLILYGGYLALRVRTIPMKLYDESKIIAFCIYNVGLSSIIITILQATSPTGRYVIFGINAFLILLSVGSTINSMLISKLEYINVFNKSSSSTDGSSVKSINSMNMESIKDTRVDELEVEMEKLRRRNRSLKQEIKELKKALEHVQGNND